MTDKDPGNNPYNDPIGHLEFDTPVEVEGEDGERWMAISMDDERQAFLDDFLDHIVALDQMHGGFNDSDKERSDQYIADLQKLIVKDLEKLALLPGDWIQIRGLSHFIFDGDMYGVDEGAIVHGRYLGAMTFPHLDYVDGQIVTALPLGAHFAVSGLSTVTDDGEEAVDYGTTDENHAIVTLHGLDIKLSRLIPVDDTPKRDDDWGYRTN